MLISEYVIVKWNPKIVKHYVNKGYNFTKVGDEFTVKVEDLTKGSHISVEVQCDYCGKIIKKEWKNYLHEQSDCVIKKDCCDDCQQLKTQESNEAKYGVKHFWQIEDVKEKIKERNIEKCGVEYPSQLPEFKEKIKQTTFDRYGVKYYTQTKEYRESADKTNLERYGFKNPSQNEEVKNKMKETNLKRYGFKVSMQNKTVSAKMVATKYKNGNMKNSKQQIYLHNLLGGELNYPIDNCSVDIAFLDKKMYLEYDGGGHTNLIKIGNMSEEEFYEREDKRRKFLNLQGWKEIRIISAYDYLPLDNKINEIIKYARHLLYKGYRYVIYNIDKKTITTSKGTEKFDFGELRKLKRIS